MMWVAVHVRMCMFVHVSVCMCVLLFLSATPELSSRTALTLPRLPPDQLQQLGVFCEF